MQYGRYSNRRISCPDRTLPDVTALLAAEAPPPTDDDSLDRRLPTNLPIEWKGVYPATERQPPISHSLST